MKTTLVLAVAIWLGPVSAPSQDERKPVPDAPAQKEAERLVRDLFKEEYAKRAPADKLALARKLLEQTSQMKDDPNSLYVLYRQARDLAVQANNVEVAAQSVDGMVKAFLMDAFAAKLAIVAACEKTANSSAERNSVLGAYLKFAEEAEATDEFGTAEKLVAGAIGFAKRLQDPGVVTKAEAKRKEIADRKGKYLRIKKARDTLVANPEDPSALAIVGRYECITKGNWTAGLPLLAKSGDAELNALAQKDVSDPTDVADKIALADGWWMLAERESGVAKGNLRARAMLWYEKASPEAAGLAKVKLDKRLIELRMDKFGGIWTALNDPSLFGLIGKVGDPIELPPKDGKFNAVQLMKMPEGEFDAISLRLRRDPKSERQSVVLIHYQVGTYGVTTWFPSSGASFTENIQGTWRKKRDVMFPIKPECYVTLVLGNGVCAFYVDGVEVFHEQTPVSKVVSFALQADGAPATFDQINIRKKQ